MTATRTRKATKDYARHQKQVAKQAGPVCEFCEIDNGHRQLVTTTPHFKIIRNRFAYTLWDDLEVADHLMIVPKAHVHSLSELSPKAGAEFTQLLGEYEKHGYSIYARAPRSKARSVVHQHTHLIKSQGNTKRFLLLIRRPYLRFVR